MSTRGSEALSALSPYARQQVLGAGVDDLALLIGQHRVGLGEQVEDR